MKTALRKAAISTTSLADGGALNRQQANAIINLVSDYSRFLSIIQVRPIGFNSGQIDKLDIGSPVTRKSDEDTEMTVTSKPTFSKVNYDTVKTVSAYDITMEAEEDNIEGAAFSNKVLNAFTERISIDMSDLAISGDASLGGSDVTSLLRKTYDGLHVKTVLAPNILDGNGLGVSLKMFKDGLNKMPVRYQGRLKDRLKWFIASNPHNDFVYEFGARATAGGDTVYTTSPILRPMGIPLEECPLFPVDLTVGTAATDGTFILLSDPKNLIWFVQRNIKIHFEYQPRKDITEATMWMRTDFEIENLNSLVKIRSVSADAGAAYA